MKSFPGVMTGPEFSDSLIHYITSKYGIEPSKMLLGASTCVDDIIYTKNFHYHPEIKGPFHLCATPSASLKKNLLQING